MKKLLTNFSGQVLSKEQMKAAKGGCQVCSSGPNGGTCGGNGFTQAEAQAMANEFNATLSPSDGYTYSYMC